MRILLEHHVREDLSLLDAAWSAPETFALLPEKGELPADRVAGWLALLPDELQCEHFALLTSGSTGLPKLVIGNRRRAERLAGLLAELQDTTPVETAVLALPLSYCYAFVNQFVWSRVATRPLSVTPGLADPDRLAVRLEQCANSMLCLVGPQMALLEQYFPSRRFPNVIRVNFAGSRFPASHLASLVRLFPNARFFSNYGCAEAMPRLSLMEVARDADPDMLQGRIGMPVPGVRLRIAEDGEVQFNSAFAAVATVENGVPRIVADDAWIGTGDVGDWSAAGELVLAGRRGDVFKRYGEKVSLERIGSTVASAWDGEFAFFSETDPSGEAGYVLVLSPPATEDALRGVLRAFRGNHPRTHWPLRIEGIPSLPLLGNGKLDRRLLAAAENKIEFWRQRL